MPREPVISRVDASDLDAAAAAGYVLGLEAPGAHGGLKTARRGSTRLRLHVTGVAAHAAVNPDAGVSATDELVDQLLAARRFLDRHPAVLANVGTVTGGTRTNVVAAHARADLLLAYLTPYVTGIYDNTKRRQTSEFDARVRQKTTGYSVGAIIYPGPRTDIEVVGRWEEYRLGEGDLGGVILADQLDHDNRAAEVKVGYAVTSLTRLVTRIVAEEDRFLYSPIRDSDSWSVRPGLEFKASALVSGLDPVVQGVTDQVKERVRDGFNHRLVELRLFPRGDDLDLFA